uniref:Uncharacterized protein n=1 Tax=Rhizophora mucronata TaxID=61149 RepID=A0A2P2L7F8_RHIMU
MWYFNICKTLSSKSVFESSLHSFPSRDSAFHVYNSDQKLSPAVTLRLLYCGLKVIGLSHEISICVKTRVRLCTTSIPTYTQHLQACCSSCNGSYVPFLLVGFSH